MSTATVEESPHPTHRWDLLRLLPLIGATALFARTCERCGDTQIKIIGYVDEVVAGEVWRSLAKNTETREAAVVHTTAQKVRMRLAEAVGRAQQKADEDTRIVDDALLSSMTPEDRADIRDEYRAIFNDEFPGCGIVYSWGRVSVYPPAGYMDQRGSVGTPISLALSFALFLDVVS